MRRIRSLVIAPFDAAGVRVVDAVRRALEELRVEVFRFDDISAGASWVNAITDAVKASDFLVVDVTRKNPNVFYDLDSPMPLGSPRFSSQARKAPAHSHQTWLGCSTSSMSRAICAALSTTLSGRHKFSSQERAQNEQSSLPLRRNAFSTWAQLLLPLPAKASKRKARTEG